MLRKATATLLLLILTIISFSGCSEKQPEPKIVYVPQKCVIPSVEPPVIDNKNYTDVKDIIAKAIINYEAMKAYAEKLLAAQKVCE